ncbi:MAG: hypothetical protein JXR07_10760 [Reichenbachiella sp.]
MKKTNYFILLILIFVAFPLVSRGNVTLNALFSDHMVVQRETKIPVWGWANPDEKISIKASWGAEAETVAGIDSTWQIKLKTPKAGGPYQINIEGENTIVLEDVLSGEVWLCGGQSNMDHHLSTYTKDAREPQYQPLVDYIREEIKTADDPRLRTMVVPHRTSIHEKKLNFDATWQSVNPEKTGNFSATGYFFAKELRRKLNIPIGIIECARGATRVQPWISEATYMSDEEMKAYFLEEQSKTNKKLAVMNAPNYIDTTYQQALKVWKNKGKTGRKPRPIPHPEQDITIPGTYYNGMVAAIVPYSIKGIIWYQGESNTQYKTDSYEKYFSMLISSWRKDWKQGDFPFYWAQLSAFRESNEDPLEENGWASINDQQRRTLKLPKTGMAVTYDIGEAKDIHPHNKMDVGKRLSLWALKNEYGFKDTVYSGPLFKNYKIKNGKIEIIFDQVGAGLMVGEKVLLKETKQDSTTLKRFQIAAEDGQWKWANAVIISKNKISVSHPDIPNPTIVRYAWSENPEGANLYNKEGLPAAVFSTEL